MRRLLGYGLVTLLWLWLVVSGIGCGDDDEVVDPGNSAPVIDSITASPDTLESGEVFTVTAYATDPDGDALAYEWSGEDQKFVPAYAGQSGHQVELKNCCTVTEPLSASVYCEVNDGRGGHDVDSVEVHVLP